MDDVTLVPIHKASPMARALHEKMSDMSEEYYCAGWLHGWEFMVWNALKYRENPKEENYYPVTCGEGYTLSMQDWDRDLDDILELSKAAGGWIYYPQDEEHPDGPSGPKNSWDFECFVPLPDWMTLLQVKKKE